MIMVMMRTGALSHIGRYARSSGFDDQGTLMESDCKANGVIRQRSTSVTLGLSPVNDHDSQADVFTTIQDNPRDASM